MIRQDEAALICDFAETYHIYDYKSMPPKLAAILAAGLPDDSRIKQKITGQKVKTEIMLLANIADSLQLLVWAKTEDGRKNRNRPKSIVEAFVKEKEPSKYASFDSIEAYEAARKRIMEN